MGRLELTVITDYFGLLFKQVYMKVISKQARKKASLKVGMEVT